jgi:hypothetical protein
MIYAAKIESGIVVAVIVVSDANGIPWVETTYGGTWVQTWPDGAMRKHFAGIGYAYDNQLDAFVPPSPYPSWVLDEETCNWEAPIPMPPGGPWEWDEETGTWVAV